MKSNIFNDFSVLRFANINKNYIDDFEIIDGEFFAFLYHKIFNNKLQILRNNNKYVIFYIIQLL